MKQSCGTKGGISRRHFLGASAATLASAALARPAR
ncbi:tripartite tricarboxylate transporter substrate binding protein, partial [Achromobacter xylosoxidans]